MTRTCPLATKLPGPNNFTLPSFVIHNAAHCFPCVRSYNFPVPSKLSPTLPNSATASPHDDLAARVTNCELCPRLRTYCAEIARTRRRTYADWEYWGRPVPSFGDPAARVLALGLAPGAHGSNRTGRPFTGDGSGNFLYPVLHATGFASQPLAHSRNDGMRLDRLWITSAMRCAPPGNKPLPSELKNCAPFLDEEVALLTELRVVVCLGKISFDSYIAHLLRTEKIHSRKGLIFTHGAEYAVPDGQHLLAAYHPSLQNTNTGLLTRAMLEAIFHRARILAGLEYQSSE